MSCNREKLTKGVNPRHRMSTATDELKEALWRLRLRTQTLTDGTRLGCWCEDPDPNWQKLDSPHEYRCRKCRLAMRL